jgi:nucleotide-binding universal stress UspA family protein
MKLLLAYDGADHTRPALEEAARVAAAEGAQVTIIAVVSPEDSPSRFGTGPRPQAQVEADEAQAYLQEQGLDSEAKVEAGDPAEEILKEASAGAYDLIVIGSRGHGPVARLVLGSVSHKVAEGAPCSVLVVDREHQLRVEPKA